MTWSYSGDPGSSPLDEVRFTIGDTNVKDPELQNEEITFVINKLATFSAVRAGIDCLHNILAKYKSLVDEKVGDVDVKWSQKFGKTQDMLDQLIEDLAKSNIGTAFAGGISIDGKEAQILNTDRVSPAFVKTFGKNKRSTTASEPRDDIFNNNG